MHRCCALRRATSYPLSHVSPFHSGPHGRRFSLGLPDDDFITFPDPSHVLFLDQFLPTHLASTCAMQNPTEVGTHVCPAEGLQRVPPHPIYSPVHQSSYVSVGSPLHSPEFDP